MIGALEVYAAANQPSIVSPFIVGGAMSPVAIAGTLTQILAEVLASVAYAQLVRPGSPVVLGAFVATIDMNSGAPTFGTPEAAHILCGSAQLARRMKLLFRSGGALCGSKLPDAQAAYEGANTLFPTLTAGTNFALHATGWLEGGLVVLPEKPVIDADQLRALQRFSEVADYRPYEKWSEEGSPDTQAIARDRCRILLREYEAPPLDSAIDEAIREFIAKGKSEEPDALT